MTASKVLYDRDGAVARITLNDPTVLNAMDLQMTEELADAIDRAGREARAILLTGAGKAFCAGANMSGGSLAGDNDGIPDVGLSLETHVNPLMLKLRDLPVPLITAVRGPAAGVGCSLALAGDIIMCSETAAFVQSFVNVGLVSDGGSTWLLSRAIGRVRTMDMIMRGKKLPADRALEWGLVSQVLPDGELDEAAATLAHDFARGPTRAIALIRHLAWRAADMNFAQVLSEERQCQREAGLTADHAEGIAAFLAKRPPQFQGH